MSCSGPARQALRLWSLLRSTSLVSQLALRLAHLVRLGPCMDPGLGPVRLLVYRLGLALPLLTLLLRSSSWRRPTCCCAKYWTPSWWRSSLVTSVPLSLLLALPLASRTWTLHHLLPHLLVSWVTATPGSWCTAAAERSETSIRTGTASHLATLHSAVIGTST